MRVRARRLAAGLAALALAAVLAASLALAEPNDCIGLTPGPAHNVARVIDGETLALDDGSEVRLVGALSPRALDVGADAGAWPLEVTATGELRALLLGKSIELAFGGERADRYGRVLAHAFLASPDGGRLWVQGHMLEQGLARAYTQAGNRACGPALLAREATARDARRGVWAEAAYQVRPARDARAMKGTVATFQLVEGRVVRAASSRAGLYLNFDSRGRRGFSAFLRQGDLGLLPDDVRTPATLKGRLMRVRGWIEERAGGGLGIDLSAAGDLELLGPAVESAAAPRRQTDADGR